LSDNLQYQLIKYHNIPTGHFILHYPRYVKKWSFWKNCDSAEKGLKGPYLRKTLMATYLAKYPNPCTNWMDASFYLSIILKSLFRPLFHLRLSTS